MLRIGELAKRSGLTIRTLRHYDALGVLRPSGRSEAGYRLYAAADVERLTRVLALRSLGMSLDEIRSALDDERFSLEDCLRLHHQRLDAEITDRRLTRNRIAAILSCLETSPQDRDEVLGEAMEVFQMIEKYYTPEQLEYLSKRQEAVGAERIAQVQEEWKTLFADYRTAMEKGLAPESEEVRQLAKRSAALVAEFTGGDPGVTQSLNKLYQEHGTAVINHQEGFEVDEDLWAYMGRAKAAAEG